VPGIDRQKNFASQKIIRERAAEFYEKVVKGFENKRDQSKKIDEYWDIYNCKLNENQTYDGDSKVFYPVVRDAVESRVKRFMGQLFPNVGRLIECVSETNDTHYATLSILHRHIRFAKLRSLIPALLRNGDVEGQWSLMMGWKSIKRGVVHRIMKDEVKDIEQDEVVEEGPDITIIPAQDLLVMPATVDNIEDAEIVAVALRLSEGALKRYVKDGIFTQSQVTLMSKGEKDKSPATKRTSDAGVKSDGKKTYYLVYKAFIKMKLDEDEDELCEVYFGGKDIVPGIRRCQTWSGKIPIISVPCDSISGSFWGKPRMDAVAQLQYQVNDVINMGMDSASYSLLPIIMTDPLKNPRVESMILAKAAIWETSPNDTQFASFPQLWNDALGMVQILKSQIMESMDVNDAMMGKAPPGRKNAQAIAQMQSEALQNINDTVRRVENEVMNPILEWIFELDEQYRDTDLTVMTEGEIGVQSRVEKIPPQQFNTRYYFRWLGTESLQGAQRVQQQIGLMNVLRGLPPQALNGRTLDIGPIVDYVTESVLGPSVAPRVIIDNRHKMTISPDEENMMLHNNLPVEVSPMDDDAQHVQSHQQAAQLTGDLQGAFRQHIMKHMAQMQAKAQAAAPHQGQPGVPGNPGVPGTPRPGAMPAPQRPVQNPPGAIPQERMQDPAAGMR